jgi:ubiquinone/menaquinone biosynthesis C-methylase UbiE
LQIAREDLAQMQVTPDQVQLLQADAFRLPLRDNSVDIVISSLFCITSARRKFFNCCASFIVSVASAGS